MKKLLAILMTLALVVSCAFVASAAADVTATIDTITDPVKAGDEIQLVVNISAYEQAYANITVKDIVYDAEVLEFTGFKNTKDFYGSLKAFGDADFSLIAAPADADEAAELVSGGVCILKFTAKVDVTADTVVSATVTANGYTDAAEELWTANEALNVAVVDGGIDVAEEPVVSEDEPVVSEDEPVVSEDEPVVSDVEPPVDADVTATIDTITDPVKAGDAIQLVVNISAYEQAYANITVKDIVYDAEVLEFTGFKNTKDFYGSLKAFGDSDYSLIAAPADADEAAELVSGGVCILKFTAKVDITADTVVSATVTANGYTDAAEELWTANEALTVAVVPGGVDVAEVEPSEVEPSEVEPSEVEPSEVEPSEVEPPVVEPSEVEPEVSEVEPEVSEVAPEASEVAPAPETDTDAGEKLPVTGDASAVVVAGALCAIAAAAFVITKKSR